MVFPAPEKQQNKKEKVLTHEEFISRISGHIFYTLSTGNPIAQVVEAEEKASNILQKANEEAKEIIEKAKKQAEEAVIQAEGETKASFSEKLEKEKKTAKESYEKTSQNIEQEVNTLENIALQKIDTAAEKIVSAFVALFSQK